MSTYRFDPEGDLTLTQMTQILREMYPKIPGPAVSAMQAANVMPTVVSCLKLNDTIPPTDPSPGS